MWLGFLSITLVLHSMTSHAADALCSASQASTNELPVLEEGCPIGKGIWGQKAPRSAESVYWIQCGLLDAPLSLKQAKSLYAKISTDIWMKPESKKYRCLIGPYSDVDVLEEELQQVRSLRAYKDAFARQVNPQQEPSEQALSVTAQPIAKKVQTIKPMATKAQADLIVRISTAIDENTYVAPYSSQASHQFYMEHDKPWNRVSYSKAIEMCSALDMRLIDEKEWQALRLNSSMRKDKWPEQMPYWGSGQKGMFSNGRIAPLKSNTLLNVACIN
jgi:hypothetical protein